MIGGPDDGPGESSRGKKHTFKRPDHHTVRFSLTDIAHLLIRLPPTVLESWPFSVRRPIPSYFITSMLLLSPGGLTHWHKLCTLQKNVMATVTVLLPPGWRHKRVIHDFYHAPQLPFLQILSETCFYTGTKPYSMWEMGPSEIKISLCGAL